LKERSAVVSFVRRWYCDWLRAYSPFELAALLESSKTRGVASNVAVLPWAFGRS
jgi:hypothetical protein